MEKIQLNADGARKIRLINYIAYGAGDLFGGGAFFIVTTYLLFYLINVVGLNPVLAGWIPLIGKLWDAVNDPLMGYIADRTPANRFGRRRVWFLVSVLPILISFNLIWLPISISSQIWKFFYYVLVYIFFFTVTTMSYVPYASLCTEMTLNSKERNRLSGMRIFFSFIATLLAGVGIEPILKHFDGGQKGYFVMGIIFSLIFALPWIPLYFGTWELPQFQKAGVQDKKFFSNFFSLFRSRTCRIHILMYVCAFGTMDIAMTLIKFYFNDYLKMGNYFVIAQGTLLLTMIAVLPLYIWISNKKGHSASYKIGLSTVFLGLIGILFLTPKTPIALVIFVVFIIGAGLAAGSLIPHQLMPFVVDVDRLMTAKERPGTYSSAMTLTRKLVLAFLIMKGVSSLLGVIHYQQAQPSAFKPEHFESILQKAEKMVQSAELSEEEFELLLKGYQWSEKENNYQLFYQKEKDSDRIYALRLLFNKMKIRYTGLKTVAVVQKESTAKNIKYMFAFMPMGMVLLGLIASFLFKLTPQCHQMILDEIERLEAGGKKAEVDPEVKKVCELLTGRKYETLYPKAEIMNE